MFLGFGRNGEKLSIKNGRNAAFWEKVEKIYKGEYQEKYNKYLNVLNEEGYLSIEKHGRSISLNVNDEELMWKFNLFTMEYDRFMSFVFQCRFFEKFSDLSHNEKEIVKGITEKVIKDVPLSVNMNGSMLNSFNRLFDYVEINIDNIVYGYSFYNQKVKTTNGRNAAILDAASMIFTDCLYVIRATGNSMKYGDVVRYIQNQDEKDFRGEMSSTRIWGIATDFYVEMAQTINWMATADFYRK